MKTFIEIKVSGPGGCIGNEMDIIKNALESFDYNVEVENKHPHDIHETYKNKDKNLIIKLVADHCPWGG